MAVVVAVACVLRVGFVLETHVPQAIRADAAHYVQYATNLHEHGVFGLGPAGDPQPDSFRSPGYPALLCLLRALFGADHLYTAARLVQALLDTATVLLAFLLARRLLPFWAALGACACTALSPHLVAGTGYLLTETLTTFGLALASWLLVRLVDVPPDGRMRGSGWLCGAAFALTGLTNESLAPLPWLLAGLIVYRTAAPRPAGLVRHLVAMLAVCALAHGAWAVRNAVALGPDAPRGSSRALQTISHGTYPGFVHQDPRWRYMPYRDDPEQPRYGEDFGHFCAVFGRRVGERPLRYLSWYAFEKPYHLWGFDGLQASREIYTYDASQSLYDQHAVAGLTLSAMRALHWPLVLLALAGAVALVRRPRRADGATTGLQCLVVCLGLGTCIGVVFAPWPRYVIPMRPQTFVLAAFAAHRAWFFACTRWSRRSHAAVGTPSEA